MAKSAIGWYAGSDQEEAVAFLTGLGVKDPESVITNGAKAYAYANPKPKKPRKPSVKKKSTTAPAGSAKN